MLSFFAGGTVLFAGGVQDHRASGRVASPLWTDTAVTPDQLRSIARTLLPLGVIGCPETLFFPLPGEYRQFVYVDSSESDPVLVTMSLRHAGGKTNVPVNAFELFAGFELTSAPSLRMPPPASSAPFLLQFPASRYTIKSNSEPDVEDPFVPGAKLEMKIQVYPGSMRFSTVEFVGTMLDEKFDKIWKTDDLERFGATAVRCRQRSVFRNAGGKYFAIIAFDAGVFTSTDRCVVKPVAASKGKSTPLIVRYLITLKSDGDIEEKAERILQNVLSRFDRGG